MKKFTKLFCIVALCFLGLISASAKTERVYATFENPSNTNTTWNAETRTFTWTATYYNQLRNIGLPSGDISKYKKLVVDCNIVTGEKFRILFYKGGSNLTLWAESGVNEFIIKDELEALAPDDYNEYLLQCDEICLSGSNAVAPGEAVINEVYLETYDDEGEKVYATFENPSNTNTTWNAETRTFTWTATYYNQLRNIGLPNGDISKYKKLVVDCNIITGEKFRILFYKGGSNLTLWAESGVNEFIIKDELEALAPDDYNEYILQCDEICLSGSNQVAPGEAVINSVYLETYPENESVDIPEIVEEQQPEKPEGYLDLTEEFPNLTPKLGVKVGNGEVILGARSKDVVADLSAYGDLTIVATPGLKLVLYMNHEVDAQQNASDYAEADAGKYVFLDVQTDENGIFSLDLNQYDKADLNCICLPWDNSNKGTVWYLLLKEKEVVDPLAAPKEALNQAIARAKMVTAVGKTEASFKNLTDAIEGAELVMNLEDVTAEQLELVTTMVNDAIAAIELAPGYSYLTQEMFQSHTAQGEEGTATNCAYALYESTDLPYGDGNVFWLNYADLSDYDQLIVAAAEGTPRFCMNRTEDNAQDNDDPATTNFIDIPGHTWGTEAYQIHEDGTNLFTIDLAKMVAERNIAYLHCIKGAFWQNVTVTDMLLYKDVENAIQGVQTVQTENNATFDLQGRRVAQPTKGLYIVNGKKTVIR